jgi:polyisoprenyl-phosphate glycosyltransferase
MVDAISAGCAATRRPNGQLPLISVVAPVYCEESGISEFYRRTKNVLTQLSPRYDHEIVMVNDGSTDRSGELLKAMAQQDPHVRVLNLARNFGHQFAITAGIDHAAGDAVVLIDADLQDPPETMHDMLAQWEEGFKVVYGVRSERRGESRFKRWTAGLFYRVLQRLSDTTIPLDAGDFRLIDRSVVNALKEMREEHRYLRGLVAWVGFPQCGLKYQRDPRYAGQTKYTLVKMARLALNAVFSFSAKPLYMAGYLGVAVTLASLLLILWVVANKLIHPEMSVTGWTSLTAVVSFLGGVQLITIGILGQYVGRIFEQAKQRPLYIVSDVWQQNPTPADRPNGQVAGTSLATAPAATEADREKRLQTADLSAS